MKRRRIALLATASVAAPVLLGGASAVADTMSARTRPVHVTKAAASDELRHVSGGGLVLRLDGVPAEFEAGGEWQEFDLLLENVSEKDVSDFTVEIQLITLIPDAPLRPADVRAQVRVDGAWVDASLWDMGEPRDVAVAVPVDDMVLPPGRVGMPVRMKFAKDAPLVEFHLGPRPDDGHAESEEEFWESAWITRPADPEPEPSVEPEPSEDPGPEPSTDPEPEPSVDPEPSEDPGPEPSADPDPEPSEDPGPEPSADPDPEPSEDPGPEPSEDPGPEPSEDPGPEPSEDPGPEPSTDPEPEPSADPSSSPGPGPSEGPAPGPGTGGGTATGGGGTGPASGGAGGFPGGGAGASSDGAGQGGRTASATGGASASGGGLAHTGSDAVTSWVLGAGGTLVLVGTALAVAGRRARRRSSGT
ncbi:hypothetical protein [Streptomyces sp. Tue 6075]|uniref:hypothetical protein n=1 Tax=Streptomyces sp. Tue 6075 TaxID=1661694 RepID=UPI00131EB630|nr:hypothetical protein [Streptomyces sp. Tue 6075]